MTIITLHRLRPFLCGLTVLAAAVPAFGFQTPVTTPDAAPAKATAAPQATAAAPQPPGPPEYHGLVTFHGLPVPGATVTLTENGKKLVTVTDQQGLYSFTEVTAGTAKVEVAMTGFGKAEQSVTIPPATTGSTELTLLSLEQMRAELKPVPGGALTVQQPRQEPKQTAQAPKVVAAAAGVAPPPTAEENASRAADGLLINGSVNNAATSQYSLAARFGNTASGKSLYSYSLNVRVDNSALDARAYSLAGVNTAKPNTNALTGGFAVQGPLKIPHVLRNGPNIFVGYQRTENSISVTVPGLVPDVFERNGDFSHEVTPAGAPVVVYNPATGLPYANDKVPISPQAQALLNLYPLPNFTGSQIYNYQVPLVTDTHQDAVNSNASKTIGRKDQLTGNFSAASTRVSNTNLLGFTDATRVLGINTSVNLAHTLNAHIRMNGGYQYSRQSTRLTPYWQNRANVSGAAGIVGNDQDPTYWGPPTLNFVDGITPLTDGQASFLRNQTNGVSYAVRWNRTAHNITAGLDFRRQEFNYLTQANPRGTFSFTGGATANASVAGSGYDLADFLIGVPTSSALAFGNADKYLRQSVLDGYMTDDWRVSPQLTVNVGARYEYGSPVTEVKQRLVNLDVAPGFTAIAPILPGSPVGALSGQSFPSALLHADRTGIEPRIGTSWRPLPGSSLLVSAGYGINYDTSVYQGIALNMAQQAPFAKSLTLENSAACPLTLANGFHSCTTTTAQNFGVDPNFRVGYLQTWNLKVQRDLPYSLQMVATYLGNKGTRGAQLFLPNTNAPGAVVTCASCPTGFEYLASNGNSTRESGQLQLRRRLKSGLTASVLYTFSKSIDDDSALGGQGASTTGSATIAQNWRNLNGERGLSNFDQRHLVNLQGQYTTGQGLGGGSLLSGWRGRVYKEWTVQTQINIGTGLPETPVEAADIVSGYSAFIRPNVTGAPIRIAQGGRFVNPAAYSLTGAGQFGNARRNSITGPGQFALNMALVRTFRLTTKLNLDAQVASANALNHVTYSSWITNINSTQFGLPAQANAMRTLQVSLRLRY